MDNKTENPSKEALDKTDQLILLKLPTTDNLQFKTELVKQIGSQTITITGRL